MSGRQNPYFMAAMRSERLEAECRESASWIERFVVEAAAREAESPGSFDFDMSSEEVQELCRLLLESAGQQRERGEQHARLREKMEPYL